MGALTTLTSTSSGMLTALARKKASIQEQAITSEHLTTNIVQRNLLALRTFNNTLSILDQRQKETESTLLNLGKISEKERQLLKQEMEIHQKPVEIQQVTQFDRDAFEPFDSSLKEDLNWFHADHVSNMPKVDYQGRKVTYEDLILRKVFQGSYHQKGRTVNRQQALNNRAIMSQWQIDTMADCNRDNFENIQTVLESQQKEIKKLSNTVWFLIDALNTQHVEVDRLKRQATNAVRREEIEQSSSSDTNIFGTDVATNRECPFTAVEEERNSRVIRLTAEVFEQRKAIDSFLNESRNFLKRLEETQSLIMDKEYDLCVETLKINDHDIDKDNSNADNNSSPQESLTEKCSPFLEATSKISYNRWGSVQYDPKDFQTHFPKGPVLNDLLTFWENLGAEGRGDSTRNNYLLQQAKLMDFQAAYSEESRSRLEKLEKTVDEMKKNNNRHFECLYRNDNSIGNFSKKKATEQKKRADQQDSILQMMKQNLENFKKSSNS